MKTSILVVENHPDLRAEIVATLNREEYECDGVANGAAAMLKLREHEYSYILLDVDGLTAGTDLLDSIATRSNVILITDTESPDEIPPSVNVCPTQANPFDTKQLLARIKR